MGVHFGGATLFVGIIAILFTWSQYGSFFLFAAGNLISFIVTYLYVVETKGHHIDSIVAQFCERSDRTVRLTKNIEQPTLKNILHEL